jgi:hypothetical protein
MECAKIEATVPAAAVKPPKEASGGNSIDTPNPPAKEKTKQTSLVGSSDQRRSRHWLLFDLISSY